jgi:hypothetical protein
MIREQRFRFVGIIFYIVFISNLFLSKQGSLLLYSLLSGADQFQAITGLVGLGALFFTSEAVGYVFGSIVRFFWVIWGWPEDGGYSTEWHKHLSKDLKEEILERFREICGHQELTELNAKIEKRFPEYSRDVFLSHFWQQAPEALVAWTSRRNTAFFASWSSVVGILLALLSTAAIISFLEMSWTVGNTALLIVTILLMGAMGFIAEFARREAWQMIDLWMCRAFSPELDKVMEEIEDRLPNENDEEGAA